MHDVNSCSGRIARLLDLLDRDPTAFFQADEASKHKHKRASTALGGPLDHAKLPTTSHLIPQPPPTTHTTQTPRRTQQTGPRPPRAAQKGRTGHLLGGPPGGGGAPRQDCRPRLHLVPAAGTCRMEMHRCTHQSMCIVRRISPPSSVMDTPLHSFVESHPPSPQPPQPPTAAPRPRLRAPPEGLSAPGGGDGRRVAPRAGRRLLPPRPRVGGLSAGAGLVAVVRSFFGGGGGSVACSRGGGGFGGWMVVKHTKPTVFLSPKQ